MSLTLGEKLRQAREERGFTLSEVAEQTRISSLYLESIENDDYKILPGGIFNKGFVKSYAKFVGLNEQEALTDYALLLSESQTNGTDEQRVYKPEVLTDDRSSSSMVPTIIVAVIILALMTIGILYGVSYLRQPSEPAVANKANSNVNTLPATSETAGSIPEMATLKVEFKAVTAAVSLLATIDEKTSGSTLTAGTAKIFEPKQSLKLSYSRSLAQAVQMTINGKAIALPAEPLVPRKSTIEFEINKENLGRIWTSGAISSNVGSAVTDANANVSTTQPPVAVPTPVRPTPAPKASPAANTAPKPTPVKTPPATVNPVTTPRSNGHTG